MMLIQHHESDYLLKRTIDQFDRLYAESKKRAKIVRARDPPLHQRPAAPDQISRGDLRLREQARGRAALERRADSRLVSAALPKSSLPLSVGDCQRKNNKRHSGGNTMRFKAFLSAIAGSAAMLGLLAPAVGASAGNPPRQAIFHGLSAAQRDRASEAHRKARQIARHSRSESVLGIIQWTGGGQRRAVVRKYRYRFGRRAGPVGAVGEDQRNAAGSARRIGAELAAVPAQQP